MFAARLAAVTVTSGVASVAAIGLVYDHVRRRPAEAQVKKHDCVTTGRFDVNCVDFKIFTGSAHPELALSIARNLGTALHPASIGRFNDGEVSVKVSSLMCMLLGVI